MSIIRATLLLILSNPRMHVRERERTIPLDIIDIVPLCLCVCDGGSVDAGESKIEFILQSPPFNLQFLIINFLYRAPYCVCATT